MASLSSYWEGAFVVPENGSGNCSLAECPNFTPNSDTCQRLSLELVGYDAIAGLRLVASLLSIIGSLSIITSVLYHKRIRSCEVFPIFVLAWADMLLSVFFVIGSAYWYHPRKHEDATLVRYLCFSTSLFTTVLTLISTNLTVVYALTLCLRMKLRAATRENRAAKCMTKRVFVVVLAVAYIVSWCTPFVIMVPEYLTNDPFWRCASDCSCGCELSYLNIFPELDWKALTNGTYHHAAQSQHLELAITLTIHYSIDLTLLAVLYGNLLCSMFCTKKGRLQRIGDELIISDSPERFREMSCKAVCRILSYFTIFVLCGIINFVVSCFILSHFASHHFHIPVQRRMALLGTQAVTLPLQGFCNALVYGWSRQMFRTKVLDDRTPLIAPAERQVREHAEESFQPARSRGSKTENRRYTDE